LAELVTMVVVAALLMVSNSVGETLPPKVAFPP
jgi:hypothetical protein